MTPLGVAMVGPVPAHWGGGGRWPGGGVSSHVSGLVGELARRGIGIELAAVNALATVPGRPWGDAAVHPTPRGWAGLLRRGGPAVFPIALGVLRLRSAGIRIPTGQALRFVGLAVHYRHLLRSSAADLLHVHSARHAQLLCQEVLGCPLPTVVTVHSVNLLVEPAPEWQRRMVRANYRRNAHFVAVSSFVRDRMIEHGAPAGRITVIPNGVDVGMFAPGSPAAARQRLGLDSAGPVVLFTGNLVRRKGVHHLIEAFAASAAGNAGTLAIVGDGPERDALERLTAEQDAGDRIVFAGARDPREMPDWYRACDLFVMPSSAEGLSISVLEAMACARPVITTRPDVGDHDAVLDGDTGLLVATGDVAALRDAVDRVAGDPHRAGEMGRMGRRRVEQEFTWKVVADKTVDLYRQAVAPGG